MNSLAPWLFSIPSPAIDSVDLGPFELRFYALFMIAGIALAVCLTDRRLVQRGAVRGTVVDIALWAVPFGIVGGRAYHVLTHPDDYFYPGADLMRTLYVWEGGLAIFGAVIAGGLGAWIGCRRKGIRFLSFGDALAPGLLLAQATGRIGNYFNQELYGLPTTLPWGLQVDPSSPAFPPGVAEGTVFHPLFLYEMVWNIAGAVLILIIERRHQLRWGTALGAYLVIYGLGRAWLESLRLDPSSLTLMGIKINLLTAIVTAGAGAALIIAQRIRHRDPETSVYRTGHVPERATIVKGPGRYYRWPHLEVTEVERKQRPPRADSHPQRSTARPSGRSGRSRTEEP